jgi:hypothetical protein
MGVVITGRKVRSPNVGGVDIKIIIYFNKKQEFQDNIFFFRHVDLCSHNSSSNTET